MADIFVPGIPKTAGSKRAFVVNGRAIITDDNAKGKDWRATIQQVAAVAFPAPMEGPLVVALWFLLLRPKGHHGKRGLRPSAPAYPDVRPDVIKLARCVEDALNGLAWRDDAQIVQEILRKDYAHGEHCGVHITVTGIEDRQPKSLQARVPISKNRPQSERGA